MASNETRYTNKVFMAGALPLLKTIATDVPELKKKFEGVNAIYQVSAKVNGLLSSANISDRAKSMVSLLFLPWKR